VAEPGSKAKGEKAKSTSTTTKKSTKKTTKKKR
jgi:hypothetical protein